MIIKKKNNSKQLNLNKKLTVRINRKIYEDLLDLQENIRLYTNSSITLNKILNVIIKDFCFSIDGKEDIDKFIDTIQVIS